MDAHRLILPNQYAVPCLINHGWIGVQTAGAGVGTIEEHAPANDGESSPELTAAGDDTTMASPQ